MMRPPPRFLYLQVNKRCNLRCEHCEFWTRKDDTEAWQDGAQIGALIEEFSEMNAKGAVVLCGGEPMLSLDRYFGIAGHARQHGLKSLSVVNGTRIRNMAMARRMIADGPDEIAISLNSQRPDLHDRTRGVKGAFDRAVAALRLLLAARKELPGSTTRIYVMGLVFDENYRELEAFYDFVLNDVGADKLKLNFLQPSFGHHKDADAFYEGHVEIDPEELVAVIKRCDARFKLGLNPVWLGQVAMYFRSVAGAPDLNQGWGARTGTTDHICNTYDRNIMIDHYGMARLCFAEDYRGMPVRRYGDLRRFWDTSHDIRDKMLTCNRLCGISHSVRRETSTTASRGATQVITAPGRLARLRERISQF
jgi:MoaA/NifB/PqqE/SkfB family radical SAM enzyme